MRLLCATGFLFFALIANVYAQASAQINNPLSSVREDFNESAVVARVNMLNTKLGGCDDDACEFKVVSTVTRVFKGNVRRGQSLTFAARCDKGFTYDKLRGDAIVFLTSFVNRRKGPFQILPDYFSIHEYSLGLVRKITIVSKAPHKRRRLTAAMPNKSLDRSGGSVFRNLIHPTGVG
jgi:hypothetical protein